MVATQLLRMMLPVSASASSSRSTISCNGSCRPTTTRTSSRLLASGKISSARPENTPLKSCRTATKLGLPGLATLAIASFGARSSTFGTESSTSCWIIVRRLTVARAMATLANSASASLSRSVNGVTRSVVIGAAFSASVAGDENSIRGNLKCQCPERRSARGRSERPREPRHRRPQRHLDKISSALAVSICSLKRR